MSENGKPRQIAFYGKGGIGKSTVACNVSVALAEMGLKVFQMGCSPKVDSTSLLYGGEILERDILGHLKGGAASVRGIEECIVEGHRGVLCAESGGPEPATGCAGKGVSYALDVLSNLRLLEKLRVDLVIYDVIGDVVCGGFAQPIRTGYAREIYIVSSGELMSIYSANNICAAVKAVNETRKNAARVGGIIDNMRGVKKERELMEEFASRLGVPLLAHLPRDPIVQEAEGEGGTVLERRPDSPQAATYRQLARKILDNSELVIPAPIELEDILELLRRYQGEEAREQGGEGAGEQGGNLPCSSAPPPLRSSAQNAPALRKESAKTASERGLRKIAIYGKGGIGKSTIASNLSGALSHMGETVMQVGCDPKRDSISTLCGKLMPTILDQLQGGAITEERLLQVIHQGYNGIWGVESGGPKPGVGCAGGGVMEALRLLEEHNIFERYGVTFALFDVLGDVVCGGFAQPMRAGYAREVYIVTCGETLTLLQINNIARSIRKMNERGADCACAGLINNMRGIPNEEKIVEEAAALMGLPVVAHIPRSDTVQASELLAQTVVQAYPDSVQAGVYRRLAERILSNERVYIPQPITLKEIKSIVQKYV